MRVTNPVQQHLVTTSATDVVHYFTDWMPAIGMEDVLATLKLANVSGGFRATVVVQTATVRIDKPDAPSLVGSIANQASDDGYFYSVATDAWDTTGLGSDLTSDGETTQGALTPTTTGKMWIQIGFRVDLTSGTFAQADVAALLGVRSAA